MFPFLTWMKTLSHGTLKADLLAGLTGAFIVLPQGVSFAIIAGLFQLAFGLARLGTLISLAMDGASHGVQLLGELPGHLPPLSSPDFSLDTLRMMAPGALAVAFLGLIEALSIARSITVQSNQHINGNQEFIGQGLSNMVGSFFSSYASSGSFTRSGVNFDAGARTPMAIYLTRTSHPHVDGMVPDPDDPGRQLTEISQTDLMECPQLRILRINGSLFFGAANHVSEILDKSICRTCTARIFEECQSVPRPKHG